jgi:thiol-disulfide isomerase/thioredoxin
MKKLLLSVAVLVGASSANAQLADGTPAPNFTATDLNGVSHTLTDYLNAGKTVIIDISATWCGPCWSYHNTHALENIYNAYGPNGSDEVMVFYVEGDGATTLADLNGTGGNTQGNWVAGTPYPILDNAQIADDYAITYFPTVYRICPDGLVYEIGALCASALKADINSACGTLTGVTNHATVEGSEIALCSTTGEPEATFENFGTNAITSGTVILKENGTQVASSPFSGNVAQFATGTVTFTSMTINPASTYSVELTQVNGGAPFNASTDNMSVVSADLTGVNITVNVFTDNYPSETTWEIRNSATNALVASGGPYVGAGGTAAGGPDALKTKTQNVTLPAGSNCYKITMSDSYGDGFGYGTNPAGQYGMEILSNGSSIINLDLGNFGDSFVRDAAMKTDASSSIFEMLTNSFNVFPNPASDVVNVTFEADNADYTIAIVDLQGRTMSSQELSSLNGAQSIALPVSNLANGSYIVTITSNGVSTSKNVVIK